MARLKIAPIQVGPSALRATRLERGFTLVELSVAATIISLMLLLILQILVSSSSALQKTETQSGLVLQFQNLGGLFTRDAMSSHAQGIELGADFGSFISPRTQVSPPSSSGVFSYLEWKSHRLYYLDPAQKVVYYRILDMTPATISNPPNILSLSDVGSGVRAVPFYRNGGKKMASDVELLQFQQIGNLIHLDLEGQKSRYGSNQAEKVHLRFSARIRNL